MNPITNETNAERLKRIKNLPTYTPFTITSVEINKIDLDWLTQQAEDRQRSEDALLSWINAKEKIKRKHEIVSGYFLEEREKRFDAEAKAEKLEKENARLREALEFIQEHSADDNAIEEAEQALKGER